MFNLSWSETAIIIVLAVLLINPKDVPGIMKGAGRLFGKAKKMGRGFVKTLEEAAGEDRIREFRDQLEKEQAIIGKMTDMDGNTQETYDVDEVEDVSRSRGDEDEQAS